MPYINIHVDLYDFQTNDLKAEIEGRGHTVILKDESSARDPVEPIDALYYAFYFGQTDKAIELARKYVQDVTGRTLP
jgi:hypothetical protein